MSHFDIDKVQGENVMLGDHGTMNVKRERAAVPAAEALAAVASLADQVEQCQQTIGEMAALLEQVRRELSARPVRRARLMPLLQLLGAGAQDVTAVATAVENVQHLVNQLPS